MMNQTNVELALEQLKTEVAVELGITINPDMTSREAGKIGGSVTQKLIELGKQSLAESMNQQQTQIPNYMIQQNETYNQLH